MDGDALIESATADFSVNMRLSSIRGAYAKLEERLTTSRLVIAQSFHQTKYAGIEMLAMHEHRIKPEASDDATMTFNATVNHAHEGAFLSLREGAATTFVSIVDSLFSAFWYSVGLGDGKERGGPTVAADLSTFELLHLAGNCLRHRHEWAARPLKMLRRDARRNVDRLEQAGFRYLDPLVIGKIVEALPFQRYLDLEIAALEVGDFICATSQRFVISQWATEHGLNYEIPYIADDETHRLILTDCICDRVNFLGRVGPPFDL